MSAFLAWMSFSEGDRRRILDVIETLRQKDARDELGIGSVRDAFSDILFPGTGTVQTRARYLLFVPWIYRDLQKRDKEPAEIPRLARDAELNLIEALIAGGEKDGVIGIEARRRLKRLPSNIYWLGLGTYRIRRILGSQDDYHRALRRRSSLTDVLRTDDGDVVEGSRQLWDPALPPAPEGFPKKASFRLIRREAEYLRDRILSTCPGSFLEHLVARAESWEPVNFPWDHPSATRLPLHLREQLSEAARFSSVMHGAAILYNLLLAEKSGSTQLAAEYRDDLFEWAAEMRTSQTSTANWPDIRFWDLVRSKGANVSVRTQGFVQLWAQHSTGVRTGNDPGGDQARTLILERERDVKGPKKARLHDESALLRWKGAAGMARLDYRWNKAQRIILDIIEGLSGSGNA